MSKVVRSIKEWRELRRGSEFMGKTIGFVPTMGNLHKGHCSLLERSVDENDLSILSVFVNPTQFDNSEDLKTYPRTWDDDLEFAKEFTVDYILVPEWDMLYPDNYTYRIQEVKISALMEGKSRPGHFEGMLTVVLKLLQLVRATRAYFGEKDYQQLELVRGLVDAFFVDTEVIGCPTVRDENGLALSSRNSRLKASDYDQAIEFARILKSEGSSEVVRQRLAEIGIEVDYVEDFFERRFGAVNVGGVRLIDNIEKRSGL